MTFSNTQVSIIIPTHNEADSIAATIEHLRVLPGSARAEIIVCDGESRDGTIEIARRAGARVFACPANRGAQLNLGAQAATGRALWFLHADAKPHIKSLEYLLRASANPKICGGNFRLRFKANGLWPRMFARIARQQRRVGIYYGDSGIWARREIFEQLNGFEEWPLFEDYDFVRRMENLARRHRLQTEHSPLEIIASSRRFQSAPLRVLFLWLQLQILFSLGASPHRLAARYFGAARSEETQRAVNRAAPISYRKSSTSPPDRCS